MEKQNKIWLLRKFSLLFDAELADISFQNNSISGVLKWEDEDEQRILWECDLSDVQIQIFGELCEFLKENQLIAADAVTLSENHLISKLITLGWVEEKAVEAINILANFDVKMVDNGKKTDSFFIHFNQGI